MSVVCAKVYNDKVIFAADSIAISGEMKITDKFTKLKKINGTVIGGCGSLEEISLLFMFAQTNSPLSPTEKDVSEYFLKFYKWKNELNLPFSSANNYLIGIDGKLFYVENLLVKEIDDFYAIGAGRDYSFAALYLGCDAVKAVEIACTLSCFVSSPVVTINMERKNDKK